MYIMDNFYKALRMFVRTHIELDIDIKLPTIKHHINGDIRFYSTKVSVIIHINSQRAFEISICLKLTCLIFSSIYKT